MTKNPKPSAQETLAALTDEQLIEKVATEVMGWKYMTKPGRPEWDKEWFEVTDKELISHSSYWNPLNSWDCTMEVVYKLVLVDCERFRFSDYQTSCGWEVSIGETGWCIDMDAKRAICIAALLAFSSKP